MMMMMIMMAAMMMVVMIRDDDDDEDDDSDPSHHSSPFAAQLVDRFVFRFHRLRTQGGRRERLGLTSDR